DRRLRLVAVRTPPQPPAIGAASRYFSLTVMVPTSTARPSGPTQGGDDEGNRGNGPSCGNGRDEAGRAAGAAGSDKRCHRSDSCVGIRRDGAGVAFDLDRSP